MEQAERKDPIRKNYFDIIEKVDKISKFLFFLCGVLSVGAIYASESNHTAIVSALQICFLIAVLFLFGLDLWVKLHLSPRASDARAKDFIASAYGQALSSDRTTGYYNNSATKGIPKVAAQIFENTLFTKEICWAMLRWELPISIIYLALWIIALATRDFSMSLVGALAQILFSEQIIARILRIFWLAQRSEILHEEMRRLYLSQVSGDIFEAAALDTFTRYEVAKATAGLTLSSKIFDKLNRSLSAQWDGICQDYKIGR